MIDIEDATNRAKTTKRPMTKNTKAMRLAVSVIRGESGGEGWWGLAWVGRTPPAMTVPSPPISDESVLRGGGSSSLSKLRGHAREAPTVRSTYLYVV